MRYTPKPNLPKLPPQQISIFPSPHLSTSLPLRLDSTILKYICTLVSRLHALLLLSPQIARHCRTRSFQLGVGSAAHTCPFPSHLPCQHTRSHRSFSHSCFHTSLTSSFSYRIPRFIRSDSPCLSSSLVAHTNPISRSTPRSTSGPAI